MTMTTTNHDLEPLDHMLESSNPRTILRWASRVIAPGRLVLSTSFGVGGIVLIHMLKEEGLHLPVIFVDTLHHFPETLTLAEEVRAQYNLDLRVERPARDPEAFQARHGPRLWEHDVERFHQVTKVKPMERALVGVDGWITARRRDQSESRANLPVLEPNTHLKINPLVRWSGRRVWDFVRKHDLPYNPLHDQGYPSIGDRPLTTPVAAGEGERAGRWRGTARTECGLHQ